MNGKFGEFIAEKRKSRGLTLRGLAAELWNCTSVHE